MLRYFRINDPYRLIGLLVIALFLFVPIIVEPPPMGIPELKSIMIGAKIKGGAIPYADLIDATAPLTTWFYGLTDLLFGKSMPARHILALIIIFSQAVYIGLIFIDRKVFSESTYVPPLLFIILFAFSYDTLALTGELIGSGFLLLALNNLFKELEFRSKRDEVVLGLGFYISLASLSSFSYCLYILAAGFIIVIYSRRDLRVFLLLLTGFTLPHLLLISSYFVAGEIDSLMLYYYVPNLQFSGLRLMDATGLITLSAVPLFFLLMSLLVLNREARFSKYQSQVLQSMFLWMAFSIIQVTYAKSLRPQSLITAIPGLCYFISYLLLLVRRRRLAEWGFWTLLLGVLSVSTLSRYGRLTRIDYGRLQVFGKADGVTEKRIVVMDTDLSPYLHNELATPFADWVLARSVFVDLDDYRNVIRVNEGFKDDLPDVIIDPDHYMTPVFDRIPGLKKHYRLASPGKYVRAD